MVSSIRTGANVYVKYGYETSAFGTTSTTAADINRTFGLKTSIGSLTLTNNRTELGKLGQIEVADYAFGTQSGSVSINYVLADTITNDLATDIEGSGDIFRAIYGAPASGVYPASGLLGQGKAPTTSESMSIEIGIETSGWGRSEVSEHKTRVLKGAILNSLSLSTSVGEPVNVSAASIGPAMSQIWRSSSVKLVFKSFQIIVNKIFLDKFKFNIVFQVLFICAIIQQFKFWIAFYSMIPTILAIHNIKTWSAANHACNFSLG